MATRSQNIKLGLFLTATVVIFAIVIVIVADLRLWRVEHTYYVVSRESVAGLEVGSPVTMRGVDVGHIDSIELDPTHYDQVVVKLSVDGEVPVPRDAKALIQFSGLTGFKVIDIAEGSTEAGVLPPGSEIPLGETTLALLETRAEELAHRATEIMASTQQLVDNLVGVSEGFSETIDPTRIAAITDQIERVLKSVHSATTELEATIGENREHITQVFTNVERASTQLQALLGRGNRILEANDRDVRAAVQDLREAARNFDALARQLRRNPGALLRSRPPRERELP